MRQEICHYWEGDVLMEVNYEAENRGKEESWKKVYGSARLCQCPEKDKLRQKIPKGGSA